MKIGFFNSEGWEKPLVEAALPGVDMFFTPDTIDDLHLPAQNDFDILCVFVSSKVTETVLAHLPNLKCIVTRSTGFDHIDLAACRAKGIDVRYVPGYGDNTVAEFAFGLMLSLTRKIYAGVNRLKERGPFTPADLKGIDLKGKTLGIIGTGRIGREAVRIGKGFGMNVIAFDPFPNETFAAEADYKYVSLEGLLAEADIITIHAPLTEGTKHLINKGNIGLIKKGAYLVNTARGGIVETDALVEALEQGILAGAALDVLEEEGEIKDELTFLKNGHPKEEDLKIMLENHVLLEMPNVLISPHTAFNTQEALERILKTSLDDIKGFLENKPVNLVP